MDGGTLYQLHNLINWRNVGKDPTRNVTAWEDFFLLAVEAHIVTAAMTVFEMSTTDDRPSKAHFPEDSSDLDTLKRRQIVMLAIQKVLGKSVQLSYGAEESSKSGEATEKSGGEPTDESEQSG